MIGVNKAAAVDKVKALHVYDFDNTRKSIAPGNLCHAALADHTNYIVFNSPLPNPKIWIGPTVGFLQTQDPFVNGGWWHDSRILAATGDGAEKEEPRAWKGWWNEKIVELIELSMKQKDALTILLTGRSESGFAELIKKMVASKHLDFDIVCLKPAAGPNGERFRSTMDFKQVFLKNLCETYRDAEEIRIYEDRIKHVQGFREFFTDYNRRQNVTPTRGPITAEVVQVADTAVQLDPTVEVAEVQRLINDHNAAVSKGAKGHRKQIKKTVFYTGYLISNADTQKLLTLASIPSNLPDNELKYLANNILITPRPCPDSILEKVGGMGNKMLWEVVGTAVFENKIWACSVRPVPNTSKYYTENATPLVVLALRKGARPFDACEIQNWQPVAPDKQLIFETTVGEKVSLRIENEDPAEGEYESLFPNKTNKRKHAGDDFGNGSSRGGYQGYGQNGRGSHQQGGRGGNGRGGGYRGNGGPRGGYRGSGGRGGNGNNSGGRGRGRGGGPSNHYRSLDDVGHGNAGGQQGGGYGGSVPYDDDYPPLGQSYAPPAQQHTPYQQGQQQGYQNQNFHPYPQYQQPGQGQGDMSGGGGYGQGPPGSFY